MNIVLANQFKNESSRLVEWLTYYRDRGITHFILCDDGSTDDSQDRIRSVSGIECLVFQSSTFGSPFLNSTQTESYRGNHTLAVNISANFKKAHSLAIEKYGKDTILGFFDVDEFLVGETRNIRDVVEQETRNHLLVSVCSFEVDSDRFNVRSPTPLLNQTTRSMSTENRYVSERGTTFKSFANLSLDASNTVQYANLNLVGYNIHAGGIDLNAVFGTDMPIQPMRGDDEWCHGGWKLSAPNKIKFLHYRSPSYISRSNFHLFDKDYLVP